MKNKFLVKDDNKVIANPDLGEHCVLIVTNAEISARTGVPPFMDFHQKTSFASCVFDHIARLTRGTPAHNALHCQVGLLSGCSLGWDWRRRPGRPRARWTDQLCNDTGSVPANLWSLMSEHVWWTQVVRGRPHDHCQSGTGGGAPSLAKG